MAAYQYFNQTVADCWNGVHDFTPTTGHTLTAALTNVLPVSTNSVIANITEISYTNLDSRDFNITSSAQSAGVYSLVMDDLILTASGTVPTFRYVVIYNSTAVSGPLVGWADVGVDVNLTNGQTFPIDLVNAQTLFTMSFP